MRSRQSMSPSLREAGEVGGVEAVQQLRDPMLLPLRQHRAAAAADGVAVILQRTLSIRSSQLSWIFRPCQDRWKCCSSRDLSSCTFLDCCFSSLGNCKLSRSFIAHKSQLRRRRRRDGPSVVMCRQPRGGREAWCTVYGRRRGRRGGLQQQRKEVSKRQINSAEFKQKILKF